MSDIGGVVLARLQGQLTIGAKEGCAELGDKFFFGMAFVTPLLAAEFPIPDKGDQ